MSFIILTKDGLVHSNGAILREDEKRVIINTEFIRQVAIHDESDTVITLAGQGSFAGQAWTVKESWDDVGALLEASGVPTDQKTESEIRR